MEEEMSLDEEINKYEIELSYILYDMCYGGCKENCALNAYLFDSHTRLADLKIFYSLSKYQVETVDYLLDLINFLRDEYFKKDVYYYNYSLSDLEKEICSQTACVFANNKHPKVKLQGAEMRFLCQFHRENTPSFNVSLRKNLSYCLGCGIGLSSISYLSEYENIEYSTAKLILARIYLIDLDYNPVEEDDKFVLKYRESLIGEYKKFLYEKIEELKKQGRNYTLNRYEYDREEKKKIVDTYDRVPAATVLLDELYKVKRVENDIHFDFTKKARKMNDDKILKLKLK